MSALLPRHGPPATPPALFAALDLGTNNCRLLIGAPTRHGFRVVDSFSRIVRLGEGLAGTGALSDAAMDRTISALSACAERLHRRPVRRLAAVATEACRRAANGPAFLARAAQETGLRPRIISPREEAELWWYAEVGSACNQSADLPRIPPQVPSLPQCQPIRFCFALPWP